MKKSMFLLFIIVLILPGSTSPAIKSGYVKLDKIFGIVAKECSSSYKFGSCGEEYLPNKVDYNTICWLKVFHILDKYHIDPNTYYFKKLERETLLDIAVSKGDLQVIEILLDKYNMRITDNTLLIAIEKDRSKALKFLLQQGGRPSIQVLQSVQEDSKKWARRIFSHYGFKL